MIKVITTEEEFKALIAGPGAIMIKFGAKWCGPCKAIQPQIEYLANTLTNVIIASVDIDDAKELAEKYEIRSVPQFHFYKDGKLVERVNGGIPRSAMEKKINSL